MLDQVLLSKKQAIPGPGSYEPKQNIDKFGIYHLSNIPNSWAPQISPRGERFKDEVVKRKKYVPGPGQYEPKDYLDGNYVLSQFKSAGVRRFGTAARMSIVISRETPGPG